VYLYITNKIFFPPLEKVEPNQPSKSTFRKGGKGGGLRGNLGSPKNSLVLLFIFRKLNINIDELFTVSRISLLGHHTGLFRKFYISPFHEYPSVFSIAHI
jgi:hypothetical protein